uniref:Reverse transcriptase domain-containing protein n=1 Tax=Cannabis sativa TaxID=3483 RepID=A0A803PBA1_CANSA
MARPKSPTERAGPAHTEGWAQARLKPSGRTSMTGTNPNLEGPLAFTGGSNFWREELTWPIEEERDQASATNGGARLMTCGHPFMTGGVSMDVGGSRGDNSGTRNNQLGGRGFDLVSMRTSSTTIFELGGLEDADELEVLTSAVELMYREFLVLKQEATTPGVILGTGQSTETRGICKGVSLTMQGVGKIEDFIPLDLGNTDIILGIQWLETLGVTHTNWKTHSMMLMVGNTANGNDEIPTEIKKVLSEAKENFEMPTRLPPFRGHEHSIVLREGTSPISVRPYQYPQAHKDVIEQLVKKMLATGIAQSSVSPFSILVLLVRKKDGSWQFCMDYCALNCETVPNKFPIPVIDELLDEIHGATIFSKLDLKSGDRQIRVKPSEVPKMAFRTHDGHYEFLEMPFGLTNTPTTFQ